MTLPRIITEGLGGSPLAQLAQAAERTEWYQPRPGDPATWRAHVAAVAQQHATRDWYGALGAALDAHGVAAARLARSAESSGVVVSTGQQAVLFGGPLYTLIKAVSALTIADAIERATGVAAAPVFWAGTDDADFAEASVATVAVTGGLRTLRLTPAGREGVTMADTPLVGVTPLITALEAACGSAADEEPLRVVRSSHHDGAMLGAAYVQLLRALVEPLGIAVLDASHPAVRRAAAHLLDRALERALAIDAALLERSEAIRAAGFTPQVEQVPGLSLVFEAAAGASKRRIALRDAMPARRRLPPESLAPNVLLRPLVERSILPSAAYVAGPGELAYFAQVSAVADALEVPAPVVLPRWSATILEPRIDELLSRLGATREELAVPDQLETRLAQRSLPASIADALSALRRDLEADMARLARVDSSHLIPPASIDGATRSVAHRLQRLERRYLAAVKRKRSDAMRDVATARAALHPNGSRQERVLNFIPFLARYGRPLLGSMCNEASRHAAVLVGREGAAAEISGGPVAEPV